MLKQSAKIIVHAPWKKSLKPATTMLVETLFREKNKSSQPTLNAQTHCIMIINKQASLTT